MGATPWDVRITEDGRSGRVIYRDASGELPFYWEFGGGEAIVLISVGTEQEWAQRHPWAAPRRDEIIQRVIAEVVRQRAAGCNGVVDDRGWISIVRAGEPPPQGSAGHDAPHRPASSSPRSDPRAEAAARHFATSARKARIVGFLGLGLLALSVVAWLGRSMLEIRTTGTPSGSPMRAGNDVVILMTRLEPYVPSLARDVGKDRYTVGILLLDVESGKRRYVELARGRTPAQLGNVRLYAVQGRRLWVDTPETMLYDLAAGKASSAVEVERDRSLAPPEIRRSIEDYATGDRVVLRRLASGGHVNGTRWLGIHAPDDIESSWRDGFRAPAVADFERSAAGRRIYTGDLRLDGSTPRFTSLQSTDTETRFNGAFVRDSGGTRLLELAGGGFLMVHDTKARRAGTVVVSRVDASGKVAWRVETELGELLDVLPDSAWPAFIGQRPRLPDQVPEPLLLIVDARTGRTSTHSLWMND